MFEGQVSAYLMRLHDEIDYDPGANGGLGANVNLDPTRRQGVEAEAGYQLTKTLRLKGALAYTDAAFVGGPYNGKQVPQVAAWIGNAGLSWEAVKDTLIVDAGVRSVGARRFGDDLANTQPMEPAYTLVDFKLRGQIERADWSLAVNNLFDTHYYDQGYTVAGFSNAVYPMPGGRSSARSACGFSHGSAAAVFSDVGGGCDEHVRRPRCRYG